MAAGPAPEARPLMDERTFLYNFNNLEYPRKTYLCHEVERQEGDDWIPVDEFKGFLHSQGAYRGHQGLHAEEIFLERMTSWNLDRGLHYRVTCYISWSPGKKNANILAKFLRENRHVHLRIFAASIRTSRSYKAGLRALKAVGAEVAMMTSNEFMRCWDSFVDHQDRPFHRWDDLDVHSDILAQRLERVLQIQED